MTRRGPCRHWEAFGAGVAFGFAVLERSGWRTGCCHPTLSRRTFALLGPRGVWLLPLAGLVFALHLRMLKPLLKETP